jgi:hypothetical protein
MTNFIPTNEKVEISQYPYGFSLRTTLFDTMEFNPKKGYRHLTQTINPKNGKLNAPKKGTYGALEVRYYDSNNHIKIAYFDFNGTEKINKGAKFVSENFDLFTPEEIRYLYNYILSMLIVDMKASVIYCGSVFEDLKPMYDPFINICKEGLKNGENKFGEIVLDEVAIKAAQDPNYNPFVVKQY